MNRRVMVKLYSGNQVCSTKNASAGKHFHSDGKILKGA